MLTRSKLTTVLYSPMLQIMPSFWALWQALATSEYYSPWSWFIFFFFSSIIFMIECQCQFIINILREKWRRKAKVVAIKESATNKFLEQWRKDIDKSVWRPGNCNSWYQRASSKIWLIKFSRQIQLVEGNRFFLLFLNRYFHFFRWKRYFHFLYKDNSTLFGHSWPSDKIP